MPNAISLDLSDSRLWIEGDEVLVAEIVRENRSMLTETGLQQVYASYHQFYLADSSFRYAKPGKFPRDPGDAAIWNRQEFEDRLAAIPGMLAVSTGSYGYVRVATEIHTSEAELQLDQGDHVTEGPLEMKTQDLTIIGCIDNVAEVLAVTPGF